MFKLYNPYRWYWLADDGRLYSSAHGSLTNETDSDYSQWLESGNIPTAWPRDERGVQSDAELNAVLAPYKMKVGAASNK